MTLQFESTKVTCAMCYPYIYRAVVHSYFRGCGGWGGVASERQNIVFTPITARVRLWKIFTLKGELVTIALFYGY